MFFTNSGESWTVECGTSPAPPHGHREPQAFAMICEPVCTCLLALLQHETLMELEESLLQHAAKKSLG